MFDFKTDLWGSINLFCLVASILLLCWIVIFGWEDHDARGVTTSLYTLYDLAVTIIWCVEVIVRRHENSLIATAVEFMFALYFVVDAFVMLIKWHMKGDKLSKILLDLIINVACYSYILLKFDKNCARDRTYETMVDEREPSAPARLPKFV